MNLLIKVASKILPKKLAYAHCDIPCGIYDPHVAQMAAHTVIRMTDLIAQLKKDTDTDEAKKAYIHTLARLTKVKEAHADLVKHEINVIWGDYFKPEHLYKLPDLNQLVFDIMKMASKTKQGIDKEAAEQLLKNVQKFAEIFYGTKGLEVVKVPSGYPSGGEIVSHK